MVVSHVMDWHLGRALGYHLLALFDEGRKFLLGLWVVCLHPMAFDYPAQAGGGGERKTLVHQPQSCIPISIL
jgi:hypothetical protein